MVCCFLYFASFQIKCTGREGGWRKGVTTSAHELTRCFLGLACGSAAAFVDDDGDDDGDGEDDDDAEGSAPPIPGAGLATVFGKRSEFPSPRGRGVEGETRAAWSG